MFPILANEQLSEKVFKIRVQAPKVAKKCQPGQFFMVRADENSERVPFTFSDWDREEGWFEFIFMVVGKTSRKLSLYKAGESFKDISGPLGNPSELTPERWVVLGGGVGLAVAYPLARELCKVGAEVSVIMGARTKDLLILEDEIRALPLKNLFITTDDGSAGEQGVVTVPLARLAEAGEVDRGMAIGPVPMMKFSVLTAKQYDLPMHVSLNPIMVDGTGMCGSCRCEVDGKTRFACIDGPDFDGYEVNWDEMSQRQRTYSAEEQESAQLFEEGL